MKKTGIMLIVLTFTASTILSQVHVGTIGGGFAFYMGELNRTNTVGLPRLFTESLQFGGYDPVGSIGYRYYFKEYWSIGAEYSHLQLSADDKNNIGKFDHPDGIANFYRNLSFKTKVNQFSASVHYEPYRDQAFWDYEGWHYSPYVALGLGIFTFNPTTILNGKEYELQPLGTEGQGMKGYEPKYKLVSLSIPVNLGLKITFPKRKFGIDIGMTVHQTFTDYIDDAGGVYANPADFYRQYGLNSINYQLADRSPDQGNPAGSARAITTQYDYFVTGQVKLIMFLQFEDGRENCFYKREW